MRQKSNGKQQFIIKRAAGFLLLIFAFTGIIGICVGKKDNRIRADSGMETERMAEENTKVASGKIKEEEVKKVALTFDDGPNPDHTETLLEGLKERNVKATFFLLGAECEKYPEIVKKIHADGHLIGVHSYEHVNLSNLTDQAAMEQVDKTDQIIFGLTGEHAQYIRPPYGCWKCNLDYETKMIEVLWDVDPLDWKTDNSSVIAKRVMDKVQEMISFCCMMHRNHR